MAKERAKLRLGVSACLVGQKVRHDGQHKRDPFLVDVLGAFVDWVPVCPEQELGLGVPREPIRLVGDPASPRLVGEQSGRDHTEAMRRLAEARVRELAALDLDGYVTKKDSPSCGMERVRVHGGLGGPPRREGVGAFARVLLAGLPLLPVEEEGRLQDPALRESFVERLFAHARWKAAVARGMRPGEMTTAASRGRRPVVVTGATGFVGRALLPALAAAGHGVRATARRVPERGPRGVAWIAADLSRPGDLPRLLEGARAAYFLVHGMAGAGDYPEVERRAAASFVREAARAGLERIVYLGGVRPRGRPSRHLASRLAVGEVLRSGPVPALELRASMIVGPGSASWQVVRDLALRLPALVLPAWARSRTRPVALEDVVAALVAALDVRLPAGGAISDLPGPDVLTVREILQRVAALRGRTLPAVEAPLPAPRLSALGVKLVSDADWRVVRELVLGLEHDLLPVDPPFWDAIGRRRLVSFDVAARRALAGDRPGPGVGGALRALGEGLVAAMSPPRAGASPSTRSTGGPPRRGPRSTRSAGTARGRGRGAPRRGPSGK